ncbi:hypothetical protein D3C84_870910 [compost metagenome]
MYCASRPRSSAVAEDSPGIQPVGNLAFTSAFLDEQSIDMLHHFDFTWWPWNEDHTVCLDAFVFAETEFILG